MEPNSLAATNSSISGGAIVAIVLIGVVVAVFMIVAVWKVFSKAGRPGWAAIIPIYNTYVLCKVAGRPGWWVIWFFIPIANPIVPIIVSIDVAKAFGKGAAFGVFLLWLIPIIGFPILGFGGDPYRGAPTRESVPA